jgi:CopG-like RHH_1 or ribbon-helix-helix domain, RHH_5
MQVIYDLFLSLMPSQKPKVLVYMPDETKQALEVLANEERRSLSQMALILIEDGLKSRGKLPREDKNQ